MKRLKDYFKNLPFMSKINTYVVLFMLFIFLLVGMCSCSVQQIEPKPDFEIEWTDTIDYETIIPPKEDLLKPNKYDYKVLSYEYPYALVIRSDSIIEYKYSTEPLAVGTCGISKKR